ncbi:hypothetical protein ACIBQX_09310 [Nonomuraea sp. NPDC049714]
MGVIFYGAAEWAPTAVLLRGAREALPKGGVAGRRNGACFPG